MVSLRRRKLLGLCSGARDSFLAPISMLIENENENAPENAVTTSNSVSVHPVPLDDLNLPPEEDDNPNKRIVDSVSGSIQLKDQNNQSNVSGSTSSKGPTIERIVKRRKPHRRRLPNNQVQSQMRGVYPKNGKWQAAIKVDKMQIHLGTVSTQVEAAHLYDKAAFKCGREPNFELPEEDKQMLNKITWDDFIEMTRQTIASKNVSDTRRRRVPGTAQPSAQSSDQDAE